MAEGPVRHLLALPAGHFVGGAEVNALENTGVHDVLRRIRKRSYVRGFFGSRPVGCTKVLVIVKDSLSVPKKLPSIVVAAPPRLLAPDV